MHPKNRAVFYLTLAASFFAFFVVLLGAYTRLTHAGLGCPDWPGCYGHLVVPQTSQAITQATEAFPNLPIENTKAWTEMIHRYCAGTLGILILVISLRNFYLHKQYSPSQPLLPSFILLVLLIFQALLGMWTVTEKLQPLVVMGHLLGGFSILATLWYSILCLLNPKTLSSSGSAGSAVSSGLIKFAVIGLFFLSVQIFLGGWTSANYAALACGNFPACYATQSMTWNFHAAFQLWIPVGHMSQAGLATIQMTHRFWGLLTMVYLLGLSIFYWRQPNLFHLRALLITLIFLIIVQVSLGILNVVWLLPLWIATAHNGVAALLLLVLLTLTYAIREKRPIKREIQHV